MPISRCKKRLFWTLAAVAWTFSVLVGSGYSQSIQVNKDNRTIAITATEKTIVTADMGSVQIGFIAYGADSEAAYANGSRVSNAVVKALTDAGVAVADIESESQNVAPVQDFQADKLSPGERAARKFQVTQSWTVRSPAGNAAKVLDLAVKAGANQSGQIDWSLKDENAAQAEAASKALQQAHTQAEQMAKSLNAKLGDLLYASNEVGGQTINPLNPPRIAGFAGMARAEPLAINPRRIEKSATVYAIFAIQ